MVYDESLPNRRFDFQIFARLAILNERSTLTGAQHVFVEPKHKKIFHISEATGRLMYTTWFFL